MSKLIYRIPPQVIARIVLEAKIKVIKKVIEDLNQDLPTGSLRRYTWQQLDGRIYILQGLNVIAAL